MGASERLEEAALGCVLCSLDDFSTSRLGNLAGMLATLAIGESTLNGTSVDRT
jgi:hypothetical protein